MVRTLLTALALAAVLTTACDSRGSGLIGVTPPATKLVFVVQPSDVAVNSTIFPAVQVHVQNVNNQTIANANVAISLNLVQAGGTSVLSGAAPTSAVNGVATFQNLRLNQAGAGFQLEASAPGFGSVTSARFNVTP